MRTWLLIGVAAVGALLPCACETVRDIVEVTADVVAESPELVAGKEARVAVAAGAKALRNWVSDIDTAEEIAMGQSLALRAFANFGRPHPDGRLQQYIAKVGMLVALQSERPSMPYSFAVVNNEAPNALALPGGFVFVSTGLLKQLASESELACVLGHEVAHVAQRHGIEIISRDRRITSLVDFGAAVEPEVARYRQFVDAVFTTLTTEGYDHKYEWAADVAGAEYAFRAGYHPAGLLPFLERAASSGAAPVFEAHKTHPDPEVRIDKIRAKLVTLGDYGHMPQVAERYASRVLLKLL
jgi:predicted Zn-dependent protease